MGGVLLALDIAAIALFLPVIAWVLDSHQAKRTGRRFIDRGVFRALEGLTGHRTAAIAYLALDWLLLRAVWLTWAADVHVAWKVAVPVGALLLAMGLVQPFLQPVSLLISLFVRTPAIHVDRSVHFPESALLEDPENFARIRAEVVALMRRGRVLPLTEFVPDMTATDRDEATDHTWRTFWLRAVGNRFRARQALPFLASLLDTMEHRLNSVFVSVLEPGVEIGFHRGPYRGLLRYHLGLIVPNPEHQWLECGGVEHRWQEGEGMLFDPVCTHRVISHAEATRVILIIDVPRRLPWLLDRINRGAMYPGRWHPFFRRYDRIDQFPPAPDSAAVAAS